MNQIYFSSSFQGEEELPVISNLWKQVLILRCDTIKEDGQCSLPRIQIVGGDSLSSQKFDQEAAEILKKNASI